MPTTRGFQDLDYRRRRDEIALMAPPLNSGEPPKIVEYTPTECETWATVFDKLTALYPTHACREFVAVIDDIGYRRTPCPSSPMSVGSSPQGPVSALQPVAGLVSAREFLGALSRRVFCATQYIRHHSEPLYTPEPDIVHELMGHAPMLAIPEFADLSQKIGEGSLKADDAQVEQLATLYWFTIEYGVLLAGRRAQGLRRRAAVELRRARARALGQGRDQTLRSVDRQGHGLSRSRPTSRCCGA